VPFTGFGAGGVEGGCLFEFADGVGGGGGGEFDQGGAGEVVVTGAAEAELAADVEQLVGLFAIAGFVGGGDRVAGGVGVAELGGRLGTEQVQRCGVLAVGEVVQAAGRQGTAFAVPALPVCVRGELEAQACHERAVVDHCGV